MLIHWGVVDLQRLRCACRSWYIPGMTNSYLAIISRDGLLELTEETAHTRKFLSRRCFEFRGGREACYWTYLPREKAEAIRWLISRREQRTALWLLSESSLAAGQLLPPHEANDGDWANYS